MGAKRTPEPQDKHTTPPAPDARPGKNPGYAETNPRDRGDARQGTSGKVPNPDSGGMERDTGAEGDPAQRD